MSNNIMSNKIMVNARMLENALTQYEWVTLCMAELNSSDNDWNDIIIPTECLSFDHNKKVLTFVHPCLRQYEVPYATLATARPMSNGEIMFDYDLAMKCRVIGLRPAIVDHNL